LGKGSSQEEALNRGKINIDTPEEMAPAKNCGKKISV